MELIDFLYRKTDGMCPFCNCKKVKKKSPVAAICYKCNILFTAFLDDFGNLIIAHSPIEENGDVKETSHPVMPWTQEEIEDMKHRIKNAKNVNDILGF